MATTSRTSSPQYHRSARQHKSNHTSSGSFSVSPLLQYQQAQQRQHQQLQLQLQQAGGPPPSIQPPHARMSPSSRYHSNLKVLRRRDPSIISIFDQFSHVCVYHHNGQRWEKQGFEGSMFLFERTSYPPYGFYILNRVGSEDYIQRLYPEDDITVHGGYLMLRSYPQFTNARLATIASSTTHTPAFRNQDEGPENKFSPLYAYANDGASSKEKGESQTIGLWTFTTDGREPLMDVMLRLHSYIKKNLPYPDEYQYGPDRSPPQNPHLRAADNSNSTTNIDVTKNNTASSLHVTSAYGNIATTTNPALIGGLSGHSGYDSESSCEDTQQHHHFIAGPAAVGLSELDKLFAKILPQPPAPVASKFASGGVVSVDDGGGHHEQPASVKSGQDRNQGYQQGKGHGQTTGISLLDSIFASIHSPLPESTVLPHTPQVLSQNVIGSLLGYSHSHAGAAGVGTGSNSAGSGGEESPTHPSSRDGDNELDGDDVDGDGDGGRSSDSGCMGSWAKQVQEHGQEKEKGKERTTKQKEKKGKGSGKDTELHRSLSSSSAARNGVTGVGLGVGGDRTPRPRHLAAGDELKNLLSTPSSTTVSNLVMPSAMSSTAKPNDTVKQPKFPNGHPLVPLGPNSGLWPYPRQQQGAREAVEGGEGGNHEGSDDNVAAAEGSSGDIVELDWEDMSALSDPKEFERMRKAQSAAKLKTRGHKGDEGVELTTGGRKKKKSKKERREIENDDSPPASPSPVPSPEVPALAPVLDNGNNIKCEHDQGDVREEQDDEDISVSSGVNGSARKKRNRRKVGKSNMTSPPPFDNVDEVDPSTGKVDEERAVESFLGALSRRGLSNAGVEKDAFVKEVRRLMKSEDFVDELWRTYCSETSI